MKIGILTFHRAINYGAVLQCYGLYKTLTDMGHDVSVIDYRPDSIEKYRMIFRWHDFVHSHGIKGKLRYLVSNLSLLYRKQRTASLFDKFLNQYLIMSASVANTYDAILFGSDQIWNPQICEGLDPMYYGQFSKGNTKFISYAASFGRLDLMCGDVERKFKNYIQGFDHISVREEDFRLLLKERFGVDVSMVCDPSLLLRKVDWEELSIPPSFNNYVLLFSLDRNPSTEQFARNIAAQTGKKLIKIGVNENPLRRKTCTICSDVSPCQFLGLIRYAHCVVTNSFHATSFSLIMHKDFYTIIKPNNNGRAKTILSIAGLQERMVNATDKVSFSPVCYDGVDEKLEAYRNISKEYIRHSLEL